MTRVLVVDDHAFMRLQLSRMIRQRGCEVCGEAANGEEAINKHDALKPHITVMDFNMPRLNGLDAARRILNDQPSACILMISISRATQLIEEMKTIGIKGFYCKSEPNTFHKALDAVLRGEIYFDPL